MYSVINQQAKQILCAIGRSMPNAQEPRAYEYLLDKKHEAGTPGYQARYKLYWSMNAARLCPEFYSRYFGILSHLIDDGGGAMPSIGELALELYDVRTQGNGRKSIQFSFASKLLHTVNPSLPIYDSMVARFYFFEPRISGKPADRIGDLVMFYDFLKEEYARILRGGILAVAIEAFKEEFKTEHHSDEKIIDSMIWMFVESAINQRVLQNKQVVYT